MRMLGVSCGEVGGSAEILLRAAMAAADRPELELQLVRLTDLQIPFASRAGDGDEGDDTWWFWEQLMEADALLISTPIYARTVPGTLRLLGDRLLGPNADAAFVEELLALGAAGKAPAVPFRVDERVLKPRVAGFIACGGSLPDHWKTLALPLLHTFTFSMQIGVVDQVQFAGAGTPASIVLDPEAIDRARRLGAQVAEQIGRRFEEVEYRGPEGLCPMCHLDVIAVKSASEIECATCGARGHMKVDDGAVRFDFPATGRDQSVISMAEKRAHFFEVQETAAAHAQRAEEIRERAQALLGASADAVVPSPPTRT
jgi:multimeric flavodoxin WrbA